MSDFPIAGPSMSPEAILVVREQLPLRHPYLAPRTPTETQVAEIWRTVLGMDRVGVDDAYRDLGGDSLMASIIFSLIADRLGVTLPMATLIEAPTIARLAERIDRRHGA